MLLPGIARSRNLALPSPLVPQRERPTRQRPDLPLIPWEDRPSADHNVVWRYSRNLVIPRDIIPCSMQVDELIAFIKQNSEL
jgi:hypothetical protein